MYLKLRLVFVSNERAVPGFVHCVRSSSARQTTTLPTVVCTHGEQSVIHSKSHRVIVRMRGAPALTVSMSTDGIV